MRSYWFKIVLAGWVLLLGLFPKQDLSQITRLPALFTHYATRHLPQDDCSFLDYLIEHYFETDAHNHEQNTDGHCELPFYHLSYSGCLWYLPAWLSQLLYPHWLNAIRLATTNTRLPIFRGLHSIFQPPQVCF